MLDGETKLAYALVRPPGHHAQPATTDGYCLFANTAIAAEAARRRGVERVAIIDWDVHHGNGTQECFYGRADVLAISLHMPHGSWSEAHPQTGSYLEVGIGPGAGCNVNIELPYGSGDAAYLAAMEQVVAPVVDAFHPDLVMVAAGQDASQFDPNGRQCVSMAGFRGMGAIARALADRHSDGRLVLVQEGGYGRSYSGAVHARHAGGRAGHGRAARRPDGVPAGRRHPRRRRHRRGSRRRSAATGTSVELRSCATARPRSLRAGRSTSGGGAARHGRARSPAAPAGTWR